MTLEQLEALDTEVLTCAQVAPVIGSNGATLHAQAVSNPEKLGFPVIVTASRVKIPRRAFIRFMKGGGE